MWIVNEFPITEIQGMSLWQPGTIDVVDLTHKWLEMHGCTLSTEATDALVLKHQAISPTVLT